MFKRLFSGAILAPLAAAAIMVASPANAQSKTGYWQKVQAAGVLRCGAAVSPPLVMRDPVTGQYSGAFSALCKEWGDVLGVKTEFVDTTWDNIVAGLQAGKWDISLALNRTPPRAMAVSFSISAMPYEISLAYNKDNPKVPADFKSVDDIDQPGVTLTVMSGTAQDKAISAAIKKATILRLPGNDETRMAVISKRADVLVDQSDTNALFVQANPDWAKQVMPSPALAKQGVAYGLPHDLSFQDIEAFNIFIQERLDTGHMDELLRQANEEVLKATKQ